MDITLSIIFSIGVMTSLLVSLENRSAPPASTKQIKHVLAMDSPLSHLTNTHVSKIAANSSLPSTVVSSYSLARRSNLSKSGLE